VYNIQVQPEHDDASLIARAKAAEPAAFGELVRRHQEVAFRAAFLIVREASAAEDIAQEAFVRAHRALGSFRDGEPFRPWLLRIVTNLALNEVRARGRRFARLERAGRAFGNRTEPAAETVTLASERQHLLWQAISELPEDDRVILFLRHFLELPEREIAIVIGKPPGTVKSRLHRAGERLRKLIEVRYPTLIPASAGGDPNA
jgi:RNA polymerase sigma-70 factor (ECF subfamily)